jgi:hypothetical protein
MRGPVRACRMLYALPVLDPATAALDGDKIAGLCGRGHTWAQEMEQNARRARSNFLLHFVCCCRVISLAAAQTRTAVSDLRLECTQLVVYAAICIHATS